VILLYNSDIVIYECYMRVIVLSNSVIKGDSDSDSVI